MTSVFETDLVRCTLYYFLNIAFNNFQFAKGSFKLPKKLQEWCEIIRTVATEYYARGKT